MRQRQRAPHLQVDPLGYPADVVLAATPGPGRRLGRLRGHERRKVSEAGNNHHPRQQRRDIDPDGHHHCGVDVHCAAR